MGRPETLQVSRHIVCPRRGDEQITSELEIEFFEVAALAPAISIGFQQGIGIIGILRRLRVIRFLRQSDLYTVIDGLIVSEMPFVELVKTEILRVPDVIGNVLQVGCSLIDGMFVEAVKASLVDDIDNCLLGIRDGQRRVGSRHLSISLHIEHRTEVDALLRITCGIACHRQLCGDALYLMGHLCRQGDTTVDSASQTNGDKFIRV